MQMSQCNLGYCCANGQGVAKDEVGAVKWYCKAADQNHARGPEQSGALLPHGQGVAQGRGGGGEVVSAKPLSRIIAHVRNTIWASATTNGQGVAKDYVEAYKWWLLAAAQGDGDATKEVPTLELWMTPGQIAEGQRLARNFKPREAPSAGGGASGPAMVQTRPESSGTGFFITEDGYLITNQHVAGSGAQVRLVTEAGLVSARVVRVDPGNDLALLKAEGRFAPLPVSASAAQ